MTRLSRIKNTRARAEKSREFRCEYCRARCTRSPDGKTEYGHMNGCPDRPDEFPNGEHNVKYRDYIDAGDEEIVTDGGRNQSIARDHLLGATVWAYGDGSASVKPWDGPSHFSRFWRVRR